MTVYDYRRYDQLFSCIELLLRRKSKEGFSESLWVASPSNQEVVMKVGTLRYYAPNKHDVAFPEAVSSSTKVYYRQLKGVKKGYCAL